MKKGVTYKFTTGDFQGMNFTFEENHIKIDTGEESVYWYDFTLLEKESYIEL